MNNFINSITTTLNPSLVNWGNGNGVLEFVVGWILFVSLIIIVFVTVRNYRKAIVFIRDSWNELRKVEWLSRKMTYQYSIITFGVLTFFIIFILGVDELFLVIKNLFVSRGL